MAQPNQQQTRSDYDWHVPQIDRSPIGLVPTGALTAEQRKTLADVQMQADKVYRRETEGIGGEDDWYVVHATSHPKAFRNEKGEEHYPPGYWTGGRSARWAFDQKPVLTPDGKQVHGPDGSPLMYDVPNSFHMVAPPVSGKCFGHLEPDKDAAGTPLMDGNGKPVATRAPEEHTVDGIQLKAIVRDVLRGAPLTITRWRRAKDHEIAAEKQSRIKVRQDRPAFEKEHLD